ncbi:MAG: hypothetical protein N2053_05910, partial [Chitinispirillaceae bacterium]|nr:hypothetical protein [Chitinispirillaceae bacterium]
MATDLSFLHHSNILNKASLDFFATYSSGQPYLRNNYYKKTSTGGEFSVILPWEVRLNAGLRYNEQLRGFAIANSKDSANYNPNFPVSKESGGGGPGLPWKGGNFYYGDRSYWRNIRTQIDISLQKKFSENFLVTAMSHLNDQKRTEYYYALNDTNHLILERYAKPEDKTKGFNIVAQNNFGDNYTLKYGVEGTNLRYSNSDIRECDTSFFRSKPEDSNPNTTVKAADRYGVFVQSFLKFIDIIEISPGARYDYYIGFKREGLFEDTKAQGVSPNLGVSIKTWKGGKVSVNGAYVYRFPTCPELYWYYAGYRPIDRKKLLPERAALAELGVSHNLLYIENLSGYF